MPNEITDIQMTLLEIARPGITTSELHKIARHAHPTASKKTIIHAAIGSLITIADSDLERTLVMQNFAIRGRGAEDRAAFRLPFWPQFIWLSLSLPQHRVLPRKARFRRASRQFSADFPASIQFVSRQNSFVCRPVAQARCRIYLTIR